MSRQKTGWHAQQLSQNRQETRSFLVWASFGRHQYLCLRLWLLAGGLDKNVINETESQQTKKASSVVSLMSASFGLGSKDCF